MIKPKEAIVSMTNRCNLRCEMCDIPKTDKYIDIPTKKVKELIVDLRKIGCKSIVFAGGEPLIREDIFELIDEAKENNLKVCITSNGTLIDQGAADKLGLLGVDVVNISIDGKEKTHDALRGKGKYKKAINALELLRRNDVETTIASIVCKQNYKELTQVLELAKKYGVTSVRFQPFSYEFKKGHKDTKRFYVSKGKIEDVAEKVKEAIDLANKYYININPKSYMEQIPMIVCDKVRPTPDKNCRALYDTISITNTGDAVACFPMARMSLGNINEERFTKIWRSEDYKEIRSIVKKGGCSGCLMSCYDENFETSVSGLKTKFGRVKNAVSRLF
ncbi:radical SAM protein [archaeon]|nr:radical SAM protein [archaeon]MBL7057360.1 radical SAM protein [Candidatus Woesearchaeota archaeon]